MHRLSKFIHSHSQQPLANNETPTQNTNVTTEKLDIYRHRKQRGVNLGSWFVLERWISESPFREAKAPAQSDFDVARGSNAKQILEQHWDTWIVDADWNWIVDRGINTVRIPIGYYHLCGINPTVLKSTEFDGLHHVFEGAWQRIANAINTAAQHGVGVLIDLHAAPGSQNADSHSGLSSHKVNFFTPANMAHTERILSILLSAVAGFENVVGIELLNEPHPGDQGQKLKDWYTSAIEKLRRTDTGIPLYISDCWQTDDYAGYISALPPCDANPITAIDHHLYRCFTAYDTHTSITEHTKALSDTNAQTPQLFERVARKLEPYGSAIVVGEWSGAVNPGSLQGFSPQEELAERRAYIDAQLSLYEKYCAGWYFWTYKKEQEGDKGWSLRDAVGAGVFPNNVARLAKTSCSRDSDRKQVNMEQAKRKALGEHTGYWSKYPGNYEHWRFSDGFVRGWDEAYRFYASSFPTVVELGFKGAWKKRSTLEHCAKNGGGSSIWEFEHGFDQGLISANADFTANYL